MENSRLGEMLLEAGLIDRFQLESALSMQRNLGGQIGSALVKLGYLPQETIDEFLATQEQRSQLPLEELVISQEILALLSLERMEELTVLPLELRQTGNDKILRVAMTDPGNMALIDKLQFMTGCKIIPTRAAAEEILLAIDNNTPLEPVEEELTPEPELPDSVSDYGSVDFSDISPNDPRLDRLLDVLHEKGILSVIDLERIKFN